MRLGAILVMALLASAARGEQFKVCEAQLGMTVAITYYAGAESCEGKGREVAQYAYQCDAVRNLPHCDPPAVYRHPSSPAETHGAAFAGEFVDKGMTMWRFSSGASTFVTPKFWAPQ